MKKVFLISARVLAVLAALAFGISLVLPGIVKEKTTVPSDNTIFGEIIQVATPQAVLIFLGAAFIGCALILFGKDIAKYIGYACELISGVFSLFAFVEITYTIANQTTLSIGFGAILSLIGFILVISGILLELLIAFAGMTEQTKAEDDTIETLVKYKKLLDQGIITEDIFLEKRNELLGISKDNVSTEQE